VNSRILMSSAAALLAAGGFACTFAPAELVAAAGLAVAPAPILLVVQALGAAWLGFALLDWHARGAPFGGIYGRPVALGNFLHFTVIATALAKAATSTPAGPLWLATLLAATFALAFGWLLFGRAPD
jgi:hypothetical protein